MDLVSVFTLACRSPFLYIPCPVSSAVLPACLVLLLPLSPSRSVLFCSALFCPAPSSSGSYEGVFISSLLLFAGHRSVCLAYVNIYMLCAFGDVCNLRLHRLLCVTPCCCCRYCCGMFSAFYFSAFFYCRVFCCCLLLLSAGVCSVCWCKPEAPAAA